MLDILAEMKITIMGRYERWRANHYSVQVQPRQPPASDPAPQPLALRSDVRSHGKNMTSSSMTRSVAPTTSASTPSDGIAACVTLQIIVVSCILENPRRPRPDKPNRM
jgi:hypothetical protein